MTLPLPHEESIPGAVAESLHRGWVAAIRCGDGAAFEAMFRAYGPPLCGFVYGYLRASDEAQEVVQDLFLWIWEHRYEWEVPGSLRTYLFKAARNRAISCLRHRRVERQFRERVGREAVPSQVPARQAGADEWICAAELEGALDRALAELPRRCREVFELNRRQHLKYAEIAELLDISVKTVEVHMGRALASLRQRLGDWVEP